MMENEQRCPFCYSEFIIHYYPVFTQEMKDELEKHGFDEDRIQYYVEAWENKQEPTGGSCMKCRRDWLYEENTSEDSSQHAHVA